MRLVEFIDDASGKPLFVNVEQITVIEPMGEDAARLNFSEGHSRNVKLPAAAIAKALGCALKIVPTKK